MDYEDQLLSVQSSRNECYKALDCMIDCLDLKAQILRPSRWKFWYKHDAEYAQMLEQHRVKLLERWVEIVSKQ